MFCNCMKTYFKYIECEKLRIDNKKGHAIWTYSIRSEMGDLTKVSPKK